MVPVRLDNVVDESALFLLQLTPHILILLTMQVYFVRLHIPGCFK